MKARPSACFYLFGMTGNRTRMLFRATDFRTTMTFATLARLRDVSWSGLCLDHMKAAYRFS